MTYSFIHPEKNVNETLKDFYKEILSLNLTIFKKTTTMKKSLILFGILISSIFAINAQSGTMKAADGAGPELTFDTEVIDYGTIERYANGEREFTFTNTGDQPLIISNSRGSCGCTVPSWPKEPIKPGEKGSIKVKYATDRVGPINKSVTVTSNSKNPTTVLRIKGTVKDVQTTPEKAAPAGPVEN